MCTKPRRVLKTIPQRASPCFHAELLTETATIDDGQTIPHTDATTWTRYKVQWSRWSTTKAETRKRQVALNKLTARRYRPPHAYCSQRRVNAWAHKSVRATWARTVTTRWIQSSAHKRTSRRAKLNILRTIIYTNTAFKSGCVLDSQCTWQLHLSYKRTRTMPEQYINSY